MTPKYMNFSLPPDYDLRYTLDYLIRRKAVQNDLPILSISRDLAALMQCTTRMLMYYRKEKLNSQRAPLSEERLEALGTYFEIEAEQLLTQTVQQNALSLTSHTVV